MNELSLQERLVKYFTNHPGEWVAKGKLADLAREKMGVTGESVGRRLRVLAEVKDMHPLIASRTSPEHVRALELLQGGTVEVERREKNHAWYRYNPPATRQVRRVVIEGGVAREVYETVSTTV
jgi:hypothetical protein